MTIYNLVFCKHDGGKQFIFQAPLDASLHSGDKVFVQTRHGKAIATVARENFGANKGLAQTICEGCGGYFPPAKVTGLAVNVNRVEEQPFIDTQF